MRALTREELRAAKPGRKEFQALPRLPISVVLDNLTSGFNVGAAFRIADAFLLRELILCGTTPVPPKPRITKTSMGTERWVPWRTFDRTAAAVDALRADGCRIVAVELADGAIALEQFVPTFPLALVFGDEMAGVSRDVLNACDAAVFIPMRGMGNSLSVVAALAIAAYTCAGWAEPGVALRQWRQRAGITQRQLSAETGVAYSTICEIERGRRVPHPTTLRKLTETLKRRIPDADGRENGFLKT